MICDTYMIVLVDVDQVCAKTVSALTGSVMSVC